MVKKTVVLALFLFSLGCVAKEDCTKGSEFEPPLCSSPFTDVTKISVSKNGAVEKGSDFSSENCEGFQLSESALRNYFSKAKLTNENDAHHTLDWSACYASGTVEFRDGKKGEWSVSRYRLGEVSIEQGGKFTLYCPSCTFKPFK